MTMFMHISQIPEKPLTPGVGKIENAERVYFFEREDGSIIFAQGKEAWNIFKNRNQALGRERMRNKFIGSSDGSIFRQGLIEAHKIFREQGLEASQARIKQAEADELAAARGVMVYPQNHDSITRGGIPIDLNTFGRN